jgi:hypothetical protein
MAGDTPASHVAMCVWREGRGGDTQAPFFLVHRELLATFSFAFP